ncbi:phosphoenolpyruvate--protein phosphotransferase [Nocardia yunnanensis]|uniref:Phosphoenolpyruvate-protein phosphotransferase n=1 Tax=Nocardia yunnanensis TaxID=2382165 RepID=A0A386Z9N8_9NOCA|nr:phosphoenolpyruvate--protein phosphotransferase [Nocardia yunnanensis]AYF74522.1 phosphoenolpyruvate--protein phosphotransferase [Nocardia yunnanensis]
MTREVRGVAAAPGIAVGPVKWLAPAPVTSRDDAPGSDVDAEIARAEAAFETVAARYSAQALEAKGPAADILFMTSALAADPALLDQVRGEIRGGTPTAHAVTEAVAHFGAQLAALGGMMAERASDLKDVGQRVVAELLGVDPPGIPDSATPFVLAAQDLAPADTATLDPATVLGLLTVAGGPTSHTAILAKALGIPAVVAAPEAVSLAEDTEVVLDGTAGVVELEPSAARREEVLAQRARQADAPTGPGRTADGHAVPLLANVGSAADAALAVELGAEGVGLFRTEFLFLDRKSAPTVAEQTDQYAEIFRILGDRPVTVRTLDAGSDKPLPFLNLPAEENPALGVRGLRLSSVDEGALLDQLSAIAAAATRTGTPVKVMAPMVATAEEAGYFAAKAGAAGLQSRGVMIEIPAAALRSEQLGARVDFFSIGTNDLSQYLFGADRMSSALAALHNPWQPALAATIAMAVSGAGRHGVKVGVCGESASHPEFACVLVGLGVETLSMAPRSLAGVRAQLAEVTLEQCKAAAAAVLSAATADDALRAARSALGRDK